MSDIHLIELVKENKNEVKNGKYNLMQKEETKKKKIKTEWECRRLQYKY